MLGKISLFVDYLDGTTLNRVVFEPMCSGFTDSSAPLRELTLKSAIALVAHLTQPNLEKLTRYLVRMQSDPEDSIRTNTVIFIGKVAPNLSSIARSKLILPAFMRAMTDGFVPCRLAGLKAVSACRSLFDEKRVASEVLPAIAPSLVDGSSEVRDAAMRAVDELLVILREYGEKMRLEEAKQPKILPTTSRTSLAASASAESSNPLGNSNVGSAPASGNSSYLYGLSSWASSKVVTTPAAKGDAPTDATATVKTIVSAGNGFKLQTTVSSAPKLKPAPVFSSLSLRDAGVGGADTAGWSDDDFDDPEQVQAPKASSLGMGIDIGTNMKTKKSLIPAFATDMDDDFMSQFDKKSAIRPRAGAASKLQTPAKIVTVAHRREELSKMRKVEKKEKPFKTITKLTLDEDPMEDGWDDF